MKGEKFEVGLNDFLVNYVPALCTRSVSQK